MENLVPKQPFLGLFMKGMGALVSKKLSPRGRSVKGLCSKVLLFQAHTSTAARQITLLTPQKRRSEDESPFQQSHRSSPGDTAAPGVASQPHSTPSLALLRNRAGESGAGKLLLSQHAGSALLPNEEEGKPVDGAWGGGLEMSFC